MMKYLLVFILMLFTACSNSGDASLSDSDNDTNIIELFVATDGNDSTNDGSEDQPFLTLAKAQEVVRSHLSRTVEPIYVTVKDGTYYLDETLVFTSEDSGAEDALVTYRAENEGGVILSGGQSLSLTWETYSGDILAAQVSEDITFDQLFINGERQHMARYPNYDEDVAVYNGYAEDAYSQDKASEWADPAGGFLHAMHTKRWGGYSYLVTAKDDDNNLELTGGTQNNRPGDMHETMRMVENIFEELDTPAEWFYDEDTHTLYYYPDDDVDISEALVEVTQLDQLVEFQGEQSDPVQFIVLDGFVFQHANRTFMETDEPLLRSDWTIHRGGAIFVNGAEDISLLNCELDQLGGNGVFVNNYNRRIRVEGCHIHDMGASAIAFVGSPDAVYNPLFQYSKSQSINDISWESGPQTDDYPAESYVNNNLIHDIGVFEKQPAGVQISMSSEISVSYNSIYNTARAGINVSEGTFGGHIIEHNDVFNTVLETNDHGSFNSWGRDRFWNLDDATDDQIKEVSALDTDITIIRNNRFRCDNGWDIDLDDGSSYYEIYNNVLLEGGLKLREGFHREVYNNIVINNGLYPHVWYDDSSDTVYNNIFMAAHNPVGMPDSDWGDYVDYNTFLTQDDKDENTSYGVDANSNYGDPLFIDPDIGNYQVESSSPALTIGFENFDTLDVGVQKESLKAIREEPVFPDLDGIDDSDDDDTLTTYWNGASVEQLSGDAFSAYGVDEETGGMVLTEVPEDSLAYQAGLQVSDVIIGIDGEDVATIDAFLSQTAYANGADLTIEYSRDQVEYELTMDEYLYGISDSSDSSNFTDIPLLSSDNVIAFSGISTSPATSNESVTTLYDTLLAENYGPVFANDTQEGVYEVTLGETQSISTVNTYSYNQSGVRGTQYFVLEGKSSDGEWKPVHGIYQSATNTFTATQLKKSDGTDIGTYQALRWICYPITENEHTSFQEFQVQ
jgi:hypothetical protein